MPDAPRWLPSPASTFPFGKAAVLALERNNLAVCELSTVAGAILARCHGVRPLQEHIAQAWTSGVSTSPTAITEAIDTLISHGLLRPMAAPSRQHRAAAGSQAPLETVAIVTANRSSALENAIGSLRDTCRHSLHLIVIDGSAPHDTATPATVAGVGAPLSATYVGAVEAARLRDRLAARGIPRAILDANLTPGGIGSGRNLAVLLAAGRALLMQDDDVVSRLWEADNAEEGLSVGGHSDQREWRFFETRANVHSTIRNVEGDVVAAHGAALGLSLEELIVRAGEHVDYGYACAHMVDALHDAFDRRLRVTFAGLAGDAARYCSHGLLFRAGVVRQELWEDEKRFARAISSREVAVVARRLTVTHDPACLGYCMGIDNTRLLPPFMPVGRNEDGVWGATLAFMDPQAFYGHLPFGIRHNSDRPSHYKEAMPSARQSRAADFLLFLITRVASITFARALADRLRHLGRFLHEVGTLPAADFRALVAEARIGTMAQVLTQAEAVASDAACPPHWHRELDEYRRVFRENVARPEYVLPIEFASGSLGDRFGQMQRFVAEFGELLIWWPEMWEMAYSMNEEVGRL